MAYHRRLLRPHHHLECAKKIGKGKKSNVMKSIKWFVEIHSYNGLY